MPTGDTKQLAILKAMTTLLETITPSNGFDFDLTGKVIRGRMLVGREVARPFITLVESPRPDPEPNRSGYAKLKLDQWWEILVAGYAAPSATGFNDDLYKLKGSVEFTLARMLQDQDSAYRLLNNLIADARIGPGVVRAASPEEGGAEAFYLPLAIRYVIDLADPWVTSSKL